MDAVPSSTVHDASPAAQVSVVVPVDVGSVDVVAEVPVWYSASDYKKDCMSADDGASDRWN